MEFKLSEYSPLCQIKWFVKVRPDLWGESIFFIRSADVEKADSLSGTLTLLLACVCVMRMEGPVWQGAVLQGMRSHCLFFSGLGLSADMGGIFRACLYPFLGGKACLPLCLDTRCYYTANNGLHSAADSLCKSGGHYWISPCLNFHLYSVTDAHHAKIAFRLPDEVLCKCRIVLVYAYWANIKHMPRKSLTDVSPSAGKGEAWADDLARD